MQNSPYKLLSALQTTAVQPNYRTLFESVPGLLISVTPALQVAAVSKLFAYTARETAEKLQGQPINEVYPFCHFSQQQVADFNHTIKAVFSTGKSTTIQYNMATTGWSISFSAVADEPTETSYVLLQLEQSAAGTADTDATIARLKEADRIKDEFLVNVAHDLRSPMHIISGYAQIVLSENGDKLTATNRQYLQHITTKAAALGELVSALLAYTKVQAHTPAPALTDMHEEMLNALSTEKEASPKITPAIKIEKLPAVIGDEELLYQVWYHLLSNAFKYSAGKPAAAIKISYGMVDGTAAFYIKDNGVGFDTAYMHKLFNPFERLHNEDDFPGSALGLALVRLAIEKQGGKVWANSQENEYALFCFTLPGAPEQ